MNGNVQSLCQITRQYICIHVYIYIYHIYIYLYTYRFNGQKREIMGYQWEMRYYWEMIRQPLEIYDMLIGNVWEINWKQYKVDDINGIKMENDRK